MLRMIRSFTIVSAISAAAWLPPEIRASEPEPAEEQEVLAEALFLCDPLPPGGRDLVFSLALERSQPDQATGETGYTASPRLQLAIALGERAGLTADVGLGRGLEGPGASVKLLLREPDAHTTGLAASIDLLGSTHGLDGTEVGAGMGAIRAFGRVGLRASASVATGVSSWSPHLHGGVSAALAPSSRWRLLAEAVVEVGSGEPTIAAGPALKLALGESTALIAGALFSVGPELAKPAFTIQLTRSM